jgi:hypothetical protein
VSRRSRRAREGKGPPPGAERAAAGERRAAAGEPRAAASHWGLGVQLLFPVAVFAVTTAVAELAGAANLGVALGIGQIAFAIAVVYLLIRR